MPYVFNPFDPGFGEDPYPRYAELRAVDPVQSPSTAGPTWSPSWPIRCRSR
jgi:hypothetical protein